MSAEAVRDESPRPVTAGALLIAAREAAGLTIEAVAQQLKLAPRQVRARLAEARDLLQQEGSQA